MKTLNHILTGKEIDGSKVVTLIITILVWVLLPYSTMAQLSPGPLSQVHADLEGLSNCTQCHLLGNKVSGDKCLTCHIELKERINAGLGYHASAEVEGKECISCHSEHNGKEFRLIRLDEKTFDHNTTGYKLSKPHSKLNCTKCHNKDFIEDNRLRNKKTTFLGLRSECLACHDDYHRATLSGDCLSCHNEDTFIPATRFDHKNARFKLTGSHVSVNCSECHKIEMINGSKYQIFKGLKYSECINCHDDPHNNQFGGNCKECHTEDSFHNIRNIEGFDHSRTNFELEGMHRTVECKACHINGLTTPLKYNKCTDCHDDYHKGDFVRSGIPADCEECHTVEGFTSFVFTISQHNSGPFPLRGAHVAVPCFECHRKTTDWHFREIGNECIDCHDDVHEAQFSTVITGTSGCASCHSESRWSVISFDHSVTGYTLTGGHKEASCRECHFRPGTDGGIHQQFKGLTMLCADCHSDIHNGQFTREGQTDCSVCHTTTLWKADLFDHNMATFKLDGKHQNVSCDKCHPVVFKGEVSFIRYKPIDSRCESCH
ncbi:MAG: cytochrome C [Bacteroidales bacterium]|nr:cytochrome C [Bacteroidales bacterium]